MKITPILILLALSINASADVVSVTADACGSDKSSALQQAKQHALQQVTGSSVVSTTTLTNSKIDENVIEYSGGKIHHYDVIDHYTDGDLTCVTIQANVDTNKRNDVIVSEDDVVDSSFIKSQHEYTKNAQNAFERLNDYKVAFGVVHTPVTFKVIGDYTEINVDVGIMYQPKWVSDIKNIASDYGEPIDISTKLSDSLWLVGTALAPVSLSGAALIRTAGQLTTKHTQHHEYSLCFSTIVGYDVNQCVEAPTMLNNIAQSVYHVMMTFWSGDKEVLKLDVVVQNNNNLHILYDQTSRIYFNKSAKQRQFASRGMVIVANGQARVHYQDRVKTEQLLAVDRVTFSMI